MQRLFEEAHAYAQLYLESLASRRVAPSGASLEILAELDGGLPEGGQDPASVLGRLINIGDRTSLASSGPRFFGFVTGGVLPVAQAASLLTSAWDQNASMFVLSPLGAKAEEVAIRWCLEALRLPLQSEGVLTTGATMANFTCLAAARHAVLQQVGWDVERDGLFGAPAITVIVGEEAHVTLYKSLSMLGLGGARVVKVPVDGQGRMRADCFPEFRGPAIVCLQAGNVNTGALDCAAEIVAKAAGAWVHVDGAFGLWDRVRGDASQGEGYELADSWATDAHKWLNVSYDCGIALVKDREALEAAMALSANYLVSSTNRDSMRLGPESSRRARGIELWAALATLGRQGLREMVERCCDWALLFAAEMERLGGRVLNEVRLNQVLVSFGPRERSLEIVRKVQEEGVCWMGSTVWQGETAMRISVSNWSTTREDVMLSVASIERALASSR
jgi:glutamate/tyrosine decarboxylase-like PLP-dependent enzyme